MKIVLCGACGRMGKNVAEAAAERGVEIAAGVDVLSASAAFPMYQKIADVTEKADVVIDFSSASALGGVLAFCEERSLPVVLAATGYSDGDLARIRTAAQTIAVFKTGNLSIGINLLQLLAKKAAQILGDAFDAEILERHHHFKKDAPSGTALMLAESVNEGFGGGKENLYGRHGIVGERQKKEIGIHAVRGGTIVGEHEVMFAGEDEIVTLSHSARSRKVFASGALQAAQWLQGRAAGLYDMNDLLAEYTKDW